MGADAVARGGEGGVVGAGPQRDMIVSMLPIVTIGAAVLGLIVAIVLGAGVNRLLTSKVARPSDTFSAAFDAGGEATSDFLGVVERLFFYGCLIADLPQGIGAWLLFKVAAKWAAWQHITKVPDSLGEKTVGDVDAVGMRNAWGSWLLGRFLLGTILNILCAGAGYAIAKMTTLLAKAWGVQ